jgi:hypothetical protein
MLQLLWKMHLQIQYTPVLLGSHEYVPEEPAEIHPQELQDVITREGNPKYSPESCIKNGPFLWPK